MQKHTLRTFVIVAIIIASLYYIYPTLGWMMLSEETRAERIAKWDYEDSEYRPPNFLRDWWQGVRRWAQFDRDRVINLGLDLQGGIHMVLGMDVDALDEERRQDYEDRGLSKEDIQAELQHIALQRIRRRIHAFEAQEPIIQKLGAGQIQIQLPGVKDMSRVTNLIMNTAYLTFHIVAGTDETEKAFIDINEHFEKNFLPFLAPPAPGSTAFPVPTEYEERIRRILKDAADVPGLIPEGKIIAFSQPPNPWDDDQRYTIRLMDEEPMITGEGLEYARAAEDQEYANRYRINFAFGGDSVGKFSEVTAANEGRHMAIVLDDAICSAPVIKERITGAGTISGNFSREQAADLAISLSSGSMPVPISEEYSGFIGASLGADSVRKGVISSVVGIALVVIFMLVYYRFSGLVANIALLLNAIMVLAALASLNATLTLPGIAGLILTVGMAVDANVLIFERIREELRNGRSLVASIDTGYKRATVTILDANVTTLIAAIVLLQFGTGPIEGFAATLSIGICASVFTTLVVTRAIFDALTASKRLEKLTMMSFIKPDTHIKFLARRKLAFTASAVVIAVGLIVFAFRGENNFGVDFTNGTNMKVSLNASRTVPVGEVRASLTQAGFENAVVQEIEGNQGAANVSRFLIRTTDVAQELDAADGAPAASQSDAEPTEQIAAADSAAVDDDTQSENAMKVGNTVGARVTEALAPLCDEVVLDEVETVGPAVGDQLRRDARSTIFYALLFVVAYLWFRFEFKFALGAVAALIHDVLVTIGLFAITGRQITMPVVAAILTIIGYSLNDTIVVFDRIREDLRLYRGRGLSYPEVMDLSINHTLSRTVLTSLTTLFVVVVLFIFGGSVINDFAFALIVGVVVGTYSSIFVASPLVHFLQTFPFDKYFRKVGRDKKNQARRGGKAKAKSRA